jgi:hypothetical protein
MGTVGRNARTLEVLSAYEPNALVTTQRQLIAMGEI